MTKKPAGKIYLLVFEGLADWEPAHALTALRRWGGYEVRSVGFTSATVMTMGGLHVTPDVTLRDIDPGDVGLLILPGGDMWEDATAYPHAALEKALHTLKSHGVPIAAICGATLAVARAGLLLLRRHTSNGREFFAANVPDYDGGAHYVDDLAVRDDHVITASGLGSIEFAREIMRELEVFPESDIGVWFDMYKHGRMPASP